MERQTTATIIPFPVRQRVGLEQSTERLAEALTSLAAALAMQRNATQRWCDALRALSEQMRAPTSAS